MTTKPDAVGDASPAGMVDNIPTLSEYGDKLIALGEALKNGDSTLPGIAALAHAAGLSLAFALVPLEKVKP